MKKVVLMFMLAVVVLGGAAYFNAGKAEAKEAATAEKTEIVIGGPSYAEVIYRIAKDEYEAKGYTTKFITFDSNPVALEGCNSGEVDLALGMNLRFMGSYNDRTGGDLAMAKPYGYHGYIGLYSEKYKSVDEIPDGAQIAIMNDSMNMAIALSVLEDCGLIKLDHSDDLFTIADIVENPKHIKLIDMDQAQTVTVLPEVDGACVFSVHMSFAGKDPLSYLAKDNIMVKNPCGAIVKKANENAKWAKDFAECFKSQKFRDGMNKEFPNVYLFYDSDSDAE